MRPGLLFGHNRRRVLLGGMGLLLLVLLTLAAFLPYRQTGGWDARINLWGPAHLLLHRQSPYRTDLLVAVDPLFGQVNAVWLPPLIGLFLPVGWMDSDRLVNLWLALNLLLLPTLIGLTWEKAPPSLPRGGLIALVLLLFPPLLTNLVIGQSSLVALGLFLVATRLLAGRRFSWAGLALVPTLSKPQLAVLVLPGLALAAFRQGKKALRSFLLALLVGTAATTLPFWLLYPAWLPDLWRAIRENPDWFQPTLYTNLHLLLGPAGWALAGLLGLGLFALNLRLWWRYSPEEVLPWSLALTTVASPYIWTWDMVLLLPLMLRCLYRQAGVAARAVWAGGMALCFGLAVWIRFNVLTLEDERHHLYAWIPWLIALLVLLSQAVEARGGRRRALLRPGDGL